MREESASSQEKNPNKEETSTSSQEKNTYLSKENFEEAKYIFSDNDYVKTLLNLKERSERKSLYCYILFITIYSTSAMIIANLYLLLTLINNAEVMLIMFDFILYFSHFWNGSFNCWYIHIYRLFFTLFIFAKWESLVIHLFSTYVTSNNHCTWSYRGYFSCFFLFIVLMKKIMIFLGLPIHIFILPLLF